MRMNRKAALMAGASFGVGLLSACSPDSCTAPDARFGVVVPTMELALGAAATETPVRGNLIVCKSGARSGNFTVSASGATGTFTASFTLAPGAGGAANCVVAVRDVSGSGVGSNYTVTETNSDALTTITGASVVNLALPPAINEQFDNLVNPTNGAAYFINSIHGIRLTFNNAVAPVTGCTFTQGYYKNHEEVVQQLLSTNGGFVVGGKLVLSQDGTLALTAAQIDENLGTAPKGGDAFLILTHQLITAELNVKGGASTPTAVANAITAARLLLNGGISPAEEDQAKALAAILDDYNNGLTGPGHCD